jgi:serine/threonine-protein kinase
MSDPPPAAPAGDDPALTALLLDQQSRWRHGERLLVEAYLEQQPQLRDHTEAVLQLILHEVLLRAERGEGMHLTEYQKRFPHLAEPLAAQFEVEQALQATAAPWTDAPLQTEVGFAGSSSSGATPTFPYLSGCEILDELGRGGMGVVYRARQLGLNRLVALKMLSRGSGASSEELARFRREAEAVARLHHPNIVQVYEVGEQDGLPYFALELVEGGTLAAKLAGAPQPPREAAELVATLARAMHYAHGQGVLHRDLKPANVLLSFSRDAVVPKITDFGLAKRLDEVGVTQTGMVVGTASYMAPEQAEGKNREVGVAADVYSLGAILYECLTGRPPFKAVTVLETLLQIKSEEPAPPARLNPAVPRDLETISLKCLRKEPDSRYDSAGALAEDLRRWLAGEPIVARPVGRLERAWRWCARNPARAGLAAALVLLAVVLGVGGAWSWQQRAAAIARRQRADEQTRETAAQVQEQLKNAWLGHDAAELEKVAVSAERTVEMATAGGAGAVAREEAEQQLEEVRERIAKAKNNRALMTALLDVAEPRETSVYRVGQAGRAIPLAQPSAEQQFSAAFQRWGLDVEATPTEESTVRLNELPRSVRDQVVAGLDAWAQDRRNLGKKEWQRLHRLADRLDDNERRREIRRIQANGQPDVRRLRELAKETDIVNDPMLAVVTLSRALESAKEMPLAEQVLRSALAEHPTEVVLLHALGTLLARQEPARLGEAIECFRAMRARRPELGVALGRALVDAARGREGEAVLRALLRQRPANPENHLHLSYALLRLNKLGEAEAILRKAIALKPDYADAHYNLAVALAGQEKLDEAAASYHKAILFKTDDYRAYVNLGLVLTDQGKLDEAVTAYRRAISLKVDDARAYNGLGIALARQDRLDEAVMALQEAIRLKSDFYKAYLNLGSALANQKKLTAAEEAYRTAIRLKPDFLEAFIGLGLALRIQRKMDEAEAAYRAIIRLKPDFPEAHYTLGNILVDRKKPDEAVEAFRKAIHLKPDFRDAYNNLGNVLRKLKKLDEAVVVLRKAISLEPTFPAYINLGLTLLQQAQFEEALAAFTKASDLLPVDDPRRPQVREWTRSARRFIQLDKRLAGILKGADRPANVNEQMEFAQLCMLEKRYAAVERFCREAFAADPKCAGDVQSGLRYNAGCCAALAGCGQGKDAASLDEKECARLRRQALAWLRADLASWGNTLDDGHEKTRADVVKQMGDWQSTGNLAGVRDRECLARLPEEERKQWQKLWADVAELRAKVEAKK